MSLAVLWHLHQPEYRDPSTGRPVMPWTRLHALRGYRDLFVETAETGVPWTLNVVPGLWQQLAYYAQGGTDDHLDLSRRHADTFTADEVDQVVHTFPCGNLTLRDLPRYRELERIIAERGPTVDELRDLVVLSTLAWTGSTARRDFPALRELLAKGHDFTEDDRTALLAVQDHILAAFPTLLARVAATDGPALSTTPLHHPILPLLIDLDFAKRSVRHPPGATLAVPEHALLQLQRGKATLEAVTLQPILGCWPSEGAVCPELVPLLAEAGFRWVATDEGVLQRSDRVGEGEGGWDLGDGIVGFFRDRELSDRVGFDYAQWSDGAAEDFLARGTAEGVRVVALDGENPWEAFRDAGGAFRARVIDGLMTMGTTLDAALERPTVGKVSRLHTGSWIGANLEIWAGSDDDHRAWQLLADAVDAVGDSEAAVEPLLAAEGSDWFWWYGPEFDTPFAPVFDAAFRAHLSAAYRAAGLEPPAELALPIGQPQAAVRPPARALAPALGEPGWLGAGEWVLQSSSMARSEAQVLQFGWDLKGVLWLRGPEGLDVTVNGEAMTLTRAGNPATECLEATVSARGQTARWVAADWVL